MDSLSAFIPVFLALLLGAVLAWFARGREIAPLNAARAALEKDLAETKLRAEAQASGLRDKAAEAEREIGRAHV